MVYDAVAHNSDKVQVALKPVADAGTEPGTEPGSSSGPAVDALWNLWPRPGSTLHKRYVIRNQTHSACWTAVKDHHGMAS